MKIVRQRGARPRAGAAEHAPPAGLVAGPAADLTTPPPGGPLPEGPTSAAQISGAAARVAQLTARIGLPGAESLAASEAALSIDPYARAVAGTYEQALPASGGVIGGAAELGADLGRARAQLAAAIRLYAAVAQFGGAAFGTRRLYGAAILKLTRQIVRRVRALLADDRVPRREREQLRSDAAELLEIDDRLRAARDAATQVTKGRRAKVDAQLDEVARQQQLFHTMLSLHRGQPVPPAEAAAAAATYEALTGAAPAGPAAAPAAPRAARRRTP